MATFRTADQGDVELLGEVILRFAPRLADAGVSVGLLYAFGARDQKTGLVKSPALKRDGQPCYATVRINSLQDRVEGKPDATVRIDADVWPEHPQKKRAAILHHELAHLTLATEKSGDGPEVIKFDDANRPVLRMRPHDLVVGGFSDVVRAHGEAAVEADHYHGVHEFFTSGGPV